MGWDKREAQNNYEKIRGQSKSAKIASIKDKKNKIKAAINSLYTNEDYGQTKILINGLKKVIFDIEKLNTAKEAAEIEKESRYLLANLFLIMGSSKRREDALYLASLKQDIEKFPFSKDFLELNNHDIETLDALFSNLISIAPKDNISVEMSSMMQGRFVEQVVSILSHRINKLDNSSSEKNERENSPEKPKGSMKKLRKSKEGLTKDDNDEELTRSFVLIERMLSTNLVQGSEKKELEAIKRKILEMQLTQVRKTIINSFSKEYKASFFSFLENPVSVDGIKKTFSSEIKSIYKLTEVNNDSTEKLLTNMHKIHEFATNKAAAISNKFFSPREKNLWEKIKSSLKNFLFPDLKREFKDSYEDIRDRTQNMVFKPPQF